MFAIKQKLFLIWTIVVPKKTKSKQNVISIPSIDIGLVE
jgi:hypothetical protein